MWVLGVQSLHNPLDVLLLDSEVYRKRSVSTVFLRQGAPVILEKWELAETQKS